MLAKMLVKAALKNGWDAELLDEEGLSLRISGNGCLAMAQEAGMHKFVSSSGKGGKRHTSYCRIEAEAAGPAFVPVAIDERDVDFKSQKAGGPGGQHVNKVETAVRATHRPSGLSVLCAGGRSQDMNKRSALQWLGAKLAAGEREAEAGRRRGAWESSARVGAGEARRSYWLDEDRYMDGPTGRKGRASDALAGGCRQLWTA